MNNLIKHKKLVVIFFSVVSVVCALLIFGVRVNYNLSDYLPQDAESTKALSVMESEFSESVPNARVFAFDISLREAASLKKQIAALDGVNGVLWLDDVADLAQPLETLDKATAENYYKDGNALFSVTVKEGSEAATVEKLRELVGENGAVSGQAATNANSQEMTVSESVKAILCLLPLIIIILLLSTSSWLEPLLYLLAIGVAVLINMGTNIFFGEVSFITQSVSPILQMAVSLDYAIFLLSNFNKYREELDPETAMKKAIKRSAPAVLASALTTLLGFLALVFMRFQIGSDLGINLAKGIVLSFISVMVFLPALALCSVKLLDKTKHRAIKPTFKKLSGFIVKARVPVLILVVLLLVPSFLAQNKNTFTYGMGALDPQSREGADEAKINEAFGKSVPTVLLVPNDSVAKEKQLSAELEKLENVTGVVSYAQSVGAEIPKEYVGSEILKNFYSENYARIIVYASTENEGEAAFSLVFSVRELGEKYYGEEALTLGESVSLYDIRQVVSSDSTFINILAIVMIGLVILFTFRSLSLPLILLLTIEGSIWINLAVPYFGGSALCYIGFLVISTVQLGATVDYAILFTDRYLLNRRNLDKKEAAKVTIRQTFSSIVVSASILSLAGFVVGLISTNDVVSQLGYLLGRGALLSAVMVLLFLPAITLLLDKFVKITTLRRRKMKKIKYIIPFLLCLCLLPTVSFAEMEQATPENGILASKEEVIYASANGDGTIEKVYAVNVLNAERAGVVKDYGSYSRIENLTDTTALTQNGDEISAQVDSRFYYRGDLQTTQLPWGFEVEYFLDEQEISVESLAGKSGSLTVFVKTAKNENVGGGWFENYMLSFQITLDTQSYSNISAQGASVANAGKNKILSFTVMPGTNGSFSFSASVKSCAFSGFQVTALPFSFAIEAPSTAELSSQLSQLSDAINGLNSGASSLKEGIGRLSSGSTDLASGSTAFSEALSSLSEQGDALVSGSAKVLTGLNALSQSLVQMPQLKGGVDELLAGFSEFDKGLLQYVQGVKQLAASYAAVDSGIGKLCSGLPLLYDGSSSLADGTSRLYSETKNLPSRLTEEIDKLVASYDKSGFDAPSFISEKNTAVDSVQFMVKISGTAEPEKETAAPQQENEESIWDRFMKLFT